MTRHPLLKLTLATLGLCAVLSSKAQSIVNDDGFGATLGADAPTGLFGPVTYTRTQGPPDTFQDQFPVPVGGSYTLWVKNGDSNEDGDPDHRVTSAWISINGAVVLTPADFNPGVDFIQKPVTLAAGGASITVQIEGQPGTFITVAIHGAGCADMTVGRLLAPWINGTGDGIKAHDATVRFALKNGSPDHSRAVQAAFFRPDGSVACRSPRMLLNPRGATEVTLGALLGGCTEFGVGSVEFYWSGHGPARLFGTVTIARTDNGDTIALPLQLAGHHRRRPPPPPTTGFRADSAFRK